MPSNSKDIGSTNGTASEVSDDLWAMVLRGVDCSGYLTTRMRIKTTLPPAASTANNNETNQYFYHSDHLGSSSFISDAIGYATQHLQYLPYGELFVDQHGAFDSRYTFSAKEKDDETQYSYFGARYYDSDLSVWLSVDPMSGMYPSLSPYNYCGNNPVGNVDPNGKYFFGWFGSTSEQRESARILAYQTGGEIHRYCRKSIYVSYNTYQVNPQQSPFNDNIQLNEFEVINHEVRFLPDGQIDLGEIGNYIRKTTPHFMTENDKIPSNGQITNIDGEIFLMLMPLPPVFKMLRSQRTVNIYRVFGGESKALGKSWSPINPNSVNNYRNVAGLPNVNTGRFVIEGTTRRSNILVERSAIPFDNNKGGILEYVLDKPSKVTIKRVSGVNPQF